ncbi:MAG: class I SAM-dependent methyltransferase [Acidobacteriota bacterium]|jgi:SAM-dependent methyltransferase|nr:class I SAM-dependent methyltransferase [Acidobacteriota bacterium]MDQ3489958.1 class I SAM-dependent methyltransferase [Acidobacteriota bacterium]
MSSSLQKEMEQHTYAIMDEAEGSHWWFVGRRAILESFLKQIIQSPQSKVQSPKILDVGCGTGANLEMLAQFGEAEGVDVSDDALEFCRQKGLKAQKGLAEALPFDDESYNIVTALDVIEHLDDDIAGLKEMFRILRPGGKTLIFVPAFMWLWGVQDDISNHRIRYTKKQIIERLEAAGFEIERATYANWTFFIPILAGRKLMKITGIKPESENNVNVPALNGIFGKLFGAERIWLKNFDFPFGVSIIVIAKKN